METLYISSNAKRDWLLWISFLAFQVLLVLLYCSGLKLLLVLPLGVLLFFFFVSNFRYCLYLLVFSLFLGRYLFPGLGTRVADFVLVILILSFLAKGALQGELHLLKTPLDKAVLLFLGVLAMSLISAVDLGLGLKNFSRHVQLFALFYVIQSQIRGDQVKRLVQFFLAMTAAHSIYSLALFISEGGSGRAFGLTGAPFADMLVASLIICYSFFLFQGNGRNRLKYAAVFFILLGALLVTQTRGAMLSFLVSYAFVSIIALRSNQIVDPVMVRARVGRLTTSMIILVLVALVLFWPFLGTLSHKFYTLYQIPEAGAHETIQLRLFMWETALRAFAAHPFLGIGVGQFTVVHLIVPGLRFSPLFQHVAGLGAHNIVLAYLSQAGILGLCALLYFMFSFLRVGRSARKHSLAGEDLCVSTALLGILFFVAASSFYAGAWFYSLNGMEFMFFLALTVVLNRSLMAERKAESASAIARRGSKLF